MTSLQQYAKLNCGVSDICPYRGFLKAKILNNTFAVLFFTVLSVKTLSVTLKRYMAVSGTPSSMTLLSRTISNYVVIYR